MVYILLGEGFEETEAIAPLDLLRRAGIPALTVGIGGKTVIGSHKIPVVADITLEEADPEALEMVVLPGGLKGVASLGACPEAMELTRLAWEKGKLVAAICAAPTLLPKLGITRGRRTTCYPGCEAQMEDALPAEGAAWVQDGNLITGTSAGCAVPFGLALIRALRGPEAAARIAEQIVIRA